MGSGISLLSNVRGTVIRPEDAGKGQAGGQQAAQNCIVSNLSSLPRDTDNALSISSSQEAVVHIVSVHIIPSNCLQVIHTGSPGKLRAGRIDRHNLAIGSA
jgi:hypothetical protein